MRARHVSAVDIVHICETFGLNIRRYEREEAMLQLFPRSLDELPAPEVLQALSTTLRVQLGVRYVALVIDDEGEAT